MVGFAVRKGRGEEKGDGDAVVVGGAEGARAETGKEVSSGKVTAPLITPAITLKC
jgi:hypothetical protein